MFLLLILLLLDSFRLFREEGCISTDLDAIGFLSGERLKGVPEKV